MIYSEPSNHYRQRAAAEQQIPADLRRRGGEEILQVHHGHATSLGNGQMRVQSSTNYQQQQHNVHQMQHQPIIHQAPIAPPRRDTSNTNATTAGPSIITYDPHLAHLISSTPDTRRESSASVTSSIGSYDSGSTLISDLGDNAIMTRLRKSFEQKEEFLRGGTQTAMTTPPHQSQPQLHPNNGKTFFINFNKTYFNISYFL